MSDSVKILKKQLDKKLKDMTDASKKANPKGDGKYVNYVNSDDLWNDWPVDDSMTEQQIIDIVDERLKDYAYANENNDKAKLAVFGAIGSNKKTPLNYKNLEKTYNVEHLKDLSDNDVVDIAVKNKVSIEDAKAMIQDAIGNKIKDNAERIKKTTKDDRDLARQYVLAKYDGDEDKMRDIKNKLGDRAEYILDESEIPLWKKGVKLAGEYLGGNTYLDKYRDQIALGEGSDEGTDGRKRALLADATVGVLENLAFPVFKLAGHVAPKVIRAVGKTAVGKAIGNSKAGQLASKAVDKVGELAGKAGDMLSDTGHRGLMEVAGNSVLDAGEGGAVEYAREKVAGEDIDPRKIGLASVAQGSVPTMLTQGTHLIRNRPIVGRAAKSVGNRIRRGGLEEAFDMQVLDKDMQHINQALKEAPRQDVPKYEIMDADGTRRNVTARELPEDHPWHDDGIAIQNDVEARLSHLESVNPIAKEILDEYRQKLASVGERARKVAEGKAREWNTASAPYHKNMQSDPYHAVQGLKELRQQGVHPWSEADIDRYVADAEKDWMAENGSEATYLYNGLQKRKQQIRDAFKSTPEEATADRLSGKTTDNPYISQLSNVDNPQWANSNWIDDAEDRFHSVNYAGAGKAKRAWEKIKGAGRNIGRLTDEVLQTTSSQVPNVISVQNSRKVVTSDADDTEKRRAKIKEEAERIRKEKADNAKKRIHNSKKNENPQVGYEEIEIEEEPTIPTPIWVKEGRIATWDEQQTPEYKQWWLDQLIHGNNGHFEVS